MIKEIQRFSHTQKKSKSSGHKDPCEVCGGDLYYNDIVTQRIGMMESDGAVNSWKCPFCESEFDLDDNILYIYGSDNTKGLT